MDIMCFNLSTQSLFFVLLLKEVHFKDHHLFCTSILENKHTKTGNEKVTPWDTLSSLPIIETEQKVRCGFTSDLPFLADSNYPAPCQDMACFM